MKKKLILFDLKFITYLKMEKVETSKVVELFESSYTE